MRFNKGMALQTTAYLIIGLVSLMLLLLLFAGHLKGMMMNTYCNIYNTLLTRIPFAELSPPSYCEINKPSFQTNHIYNQNRDDIIAHITSEIVKCYMKMSSQPLSDNVICNEIVLKAENINEPITEEDITRYLYNNNLCGLIGNNDIPIILENGEEVRCGDSNHINFTTQISSSNNHAFVIYDYNTDTVIVK